MKEKLTSKDKVVLTFSILILIILFVNILLYIFHNSDYSNKIHEFDDTHIHLIEDINGLEERVDVLDDRVEVLEEKINNGRNS